MRLSGYERAVHRAVFDAVFPGIPERVPAARDHDLVGAHERMLAEMPRPHAIAFRAAFLAVQLLLPLLMLGRPVPFTWLARERGEAAIAGLVKHRAYLMRQLGLVVKTATSFAYFQQPGVRAHFGLPPIADAGAPAVRRTA